MFVGGPGWECVRACDGVWPSPPLTSSVAQHLLALRLSSEVGLPLGEGDGHILAVFSSVSNKPSRAVHSPLTQGK